MVSRAEKTEVHNLSERIENVLKEKGLNGGIRLTLSGNAQEDIAYMKRVEYALQNFNPADYVW